MLEALGIDKDYLYAIGGVIAGIVAGFFGYFKRPRPGTTMIDPVLAGVGMELGSREQTERLITATNRCAEELHRIANAITDERTELITDRIDDQTAVLNNLAKTVEGLLNRERRGIK